MTKGKYAHAAATRRAQSMEDALRVATEQYADLKAKALVWKADAERCLAARQRVAELERQIAADLPEKLKAERDRHVAKEIEWQQTVDTMKRLVEKLHRHSFGLSATDMDDLRASLGSDEVRRMDLGDADGTSRWYRRTRAVADHAALAKMSRLARSCDRCGKEASLANVWPFQIAFRNPNGVATEAELPPRVLTMCNVCFGVALGLEANDLEPAPQWPPVGYRNVEINYEER